jgi:hypothetical protein
MTRSEPLVINVDPEHTGLRFAIILILFAALVASYFLVRWMLQLLAPELGSPGILACFGALPLSLLLGWVAENLLRRSWHSGRRLLLDGEQLRLDRPEAADVTLHVDEPLQQLWWTFSLSDYPRGGRERRMPKSWRCVAGQLLQDGTRIIPFCFAPPARVEAWEDLQEFQLLKPGEVYDTSLTARLSGPARPELPAEIVAGEQGRFWLAERNRWQEGVELTPDDFELLLRRLQPHAGRQPPAAGNRLMTDDNR